MTLNSSQNEDITPVTQIRLRCTALSLPTWVCQGDGSIEETPTHWSEARAWFDTRRLRDMIESCARRVFEFDEAEVVELFDGCWALPVIVEEDIDQRCVVLAIAFEPRAMQAKQFELITAEASMAQDEASAALASVATHRREDITRHHAVMRWFNSDLAQILEDELTISDLSRHLSDTYEQISAIYKLGRSMNCLDDTSEYVHLASAQLRSLLSFRWIAVQYVECPVGQKSPEQLVVAGELPQDPEEFSAQAMSILEGWPGDQWTRILDPSQHELAAVVHSQVIVEPILHDGHLIGAIFAGGKSSFDDEVTSVDTQLLDVAADFLGVFHQNAARYEVQRTLFMGTVRALSQAIDAKDPYTRGHSDRVAHLALRIGRELGLDQHRQQGLYVAGLVHDVGKIGVPEAVLTKTGQLTDAEFELIKRHPVIGYEILKDIPPMQQMLPGVLYHHEHWDGTGYPDGLAGEDIPLFGRILAVADAFDAMSSDRAYRSRLTREKVLDMRGSPCDRGFAPEPHCPPAEPASPDPPGRPAQPTLRPASAVPTSLRS